jgi:inactivated superfamily I helicase
MDGELSRELGEKQELTAKDLKAGLSGDYNERMQEEKRIILTLSYGQRPEVTFEGFWNNRLVHNAMNAISRAYRLRKHKQIRTGALAPKETGDVIKA